MEIERLGRVPNEKFWGFVNKTVALIRNMEKVPTDADLANMVMENHPVSSGLAYKIAVQAKAKLPREKEKERVHLMTACLAVRSEPNRNFLRERLVIGGPFAGAVSDDTIRQAWKIVDAEEPVVFTPYEPVAEIPAKPEPKAVKVLVFRSEPEKNGHKPPLRKPPMETETPDGMPAKPGSGRRVVNMENRRRDNRRHFHDDGRRSRGRDRGRSGQEY